MLRGRAAKPSMLSAEEPGAPPAPTATRRQDKVLTMKSASMKVVHAAPDKPALTLAKAFDSYEATMRLAAMTGMDKELAGFADTAPHQNASNAAPATAAGRSSSRSDKSARRTRGQRGGYTWLWVVSVVAIVAAAALFVFR